jgi:uncharacterized membrane protein YccC
VGAAVGVGAAAGLVGGAVVGAGVVGSGVGASVLVALVDVLVGVVTGVVPATWVAACWPPASVEQAASVPTRAQATATSAARDREARSADGRV